jgi:hypothetical protein
LVLFKAFGQCEPHSFKSSKKELVDTIGMMVTEGGQKYELNNFKICVLGPSPLILVSPVVDAEHAVCFVHTFMLHTFEACWD